MYTHDTYLSPLTWRYGSPEIRALWSEQHKRLLMRRFWVALATAEHEAGLVSAEQLADLVAHQNDIDLERAYRSSVDPRLNYEQSLEIAMSIVRKQSALTAPAASR